MVLLIATCLLLGGSQRAMANGGIPELNLPTVVTAGVIKKADGRLHLKHKGFTLELLTVTEVKSGKVQDFRIYGPGVKIDGVGSDYDDLRPGMRVRVTCYKPGLKYDKTETNPEGNIGWDGYAYLIEATRKKGKE